MSLMRLMLLPPSLLVLIQAATASAIPYTPLTILSTKQSGNILIYILEPPSPSSAQGRLRSLSPSVSLSDHDLAFNTVSNGLPFLQQDPSLAWAASIDSDGYIAVVAGQCDASASSSTVWNFIPDTHTSIGSGIWSRRSVDTEGAGFVGTKASINFLAVSIAFSPMRTANASIYTFGGMCPDDSNSSGDWISSATYSKQVVILEPDAQSEYDFAMGTSRGQPIAEAGFTVTPLQAAYSNTTDGSQSKAQSFLLLGGHTRSAFINMSQVALFSLPQASWTFLPIDTGSSKTDLMPRSDAQAGVAPRSGHTSLLTSDGSKVVMCGGWVGDTASPASPQLAILDIGAGYGGSGPWSWAEQPAQPALTSGASGLYGHGATMLDGDVMMIMGGFEVSASKARRKRAAQVANTQTLFYNVSADQWIPSYNPRLARPGVAADHSGGALATKSQRIGLATGLPLGLLLVGLCALAAWILTKRFRRRRIVNDDEDRELREKEIHDLSAAANPYDDNVFGYSPMHDRGTDPYAAGVWDGRVQHGYGHEAPPNVWRGDSIREAERTGLDIDVPSPQRGLRRSMGGRGYQSSPMYDGTRPRRGSSTIHPIQERDEDEDALISTEPEPEDPFQDPKHMVGSPTKGFSEPSTTVVGEQQPSLLGLESKDKHGWVQDWAAATSNRVMQGRVSPTKSDRTLSSLSGRSVRSEASAVSSASGRGKASTSRRPPGRSLRVLPAAFNPFATSDSGSPTHDSSPTGRHTPGSTNTLGADGDSFMTAHSTSATLQAESDALLGPARPGQAQASYNVEPDMEPTFTRSGGHRAPSTKVGSWVGSVKRVINHAGRSASLTTASARAADMPTSGPDGLGGLMVYSTRESAASSPTKKGGVGALAPHDDLQPAPVGTSETWAVRRSASDGASLWAAKRGAKDWETETTRNRRTSSFAAETRPGWRSGVAGSDCTERTPASSRPLTSSGLTNGDDADDDWDVEAAVEERSVQVMFSVPREKLRVVNAEVEASSISDIGQEEFGLERDDHLGQKVIAREGL